MMNTMPVSEVIEKVADVCKIKHLARICNGILHRFILLLIK